MARGCRLLSHRSGNVVQLCIMCLLACGAVTQLSFVYGVSGQQAVNRQVTAERFSRRRQRQEWPGEPPDEKQYLKALTTRMTQAATAKRLIEVVDEALDGPVFDFFLASAAYHRLAKLKTTRCLQQSDWDSPVVWKLHTKIQEMVQQDQLNEQATANILWSIAKLSDRFSVPTKLLDALVQSLPAKAKGMTTQALSNCLWACAQLKEVAPAVLEVVPPIVAQMIRKARDMNPQQMSNSLWACGQLKDVAPDVLEVVPAIVNQIPDKANGLKPQELSNCLWAALQLKDDAPAVLEIVPVLVEETKSKIRYMKPQEVANSVEALVLLLGSAPEVAGLVPHDAEAAILRIAAARLNSMLPSMQGRDLLFAVTVTVWACAKARVYHREFLSSIVSRFGSGNDISSLRRFNLCALPWSYEVLDDEQDFTDFRELLMSEVGRQGYSQADVESCRLGRFQWNRAKG
eukprot:Skav208052  [mRNA]  locus=scaffold1124:104867:106243:- [translate_table: standard]